MELTFKVKNEITLSYGRDTVYQAISDNVMELEPYLPPVDRIKRIQDRKDQGKRYTKEEWIIDPSHVPSTVAYWFDLNKVRWTMETAWVHEDYESRWNITLHDLDFARAHGKINYYTKDENKTTVSILAIVEIDNVPFVPSFMSGKVEDVITNMSQNLVDEAANELRSNVDEFVDQSVK